MNGCIRAALLVAAMSVLGATSVEAGIYKCTGPDGKTFFTGDPTACKGAQPHVLKKKVQSVLDDKSSPVLRNGGLPVRPPPGARARNDGLQDMWRRKRPAAQQELKQLDERITNMNTVIKACNRGGEWYQTEASGIRKHIPCEELRSKQADLQKRRTELVEYLRDGLEDECRRAGCQPGWVR